MTTKEKIFNEQEFEAFLKSDTCKPYKLFKNEDRYSRSKCYTKININDEYSLLVDFNNTNYNNLERISKSQYDFDFEAIYFHNLNAILFESSYDMGVLEGKCESIKLYSLGKRYEVLFDEFNEEFLKRDTYLREAFKNEKEKIEELKEQCKENVLRIMLGDQEEKNQLMSDYKFKDIKNRQMVYEYLKNPTNYIIQFVDEYLKNKDNFDLLKHIICRRIAIDQLIKEIEKNEYVMKAKYVYELLQTELKDAKKIWLCTKDGKEIQVENRFYKLHYCNVSIGDYSTNRKLEDIASIRYSRKKYEIIS